MTAMTDSHIYVSIFNNVDFIPASNVDSERGFFILRKIHRPKARVKSRNFNYLIELISYCYETSYPDKVLEKYKKCH